MATKPTGTKPAAKPMTKSTAKPAMKSSMKNSKTEFAQEMCELTDKDIISDVLGGQKALVKLYGTALCESSCDKMRKLVNQHLTECACDQFDAFLYMNERGMYPTEMAPVQKVQQAKDKFCTCEQQMKK